MKDQKKKPLEKEWEAMNQSGYDWPRPKRISVYIFDAQLRMLKQIAKDRGMRLRHVFFESFQWYIGTYLQDEKDKEGEYGKR